MIHNNGVFKKKERKIAIELTYILKKTTCNSKGEYTCLCGPNYTWFHKGPEEKQKQF